MSLAPESKHTLRNHGFVQSSPGVQHLSADVRGLFIKEDTTKHKLNEVVFLPSFQVLLVNRGKDRNKVNK